MSTEPGIEGKQDYLSSPYVTAGNRLYIIGNQDGTFPDLGWHVKGEMGGVWDHPIKLFDGFSAAVNGQCLTAADRFTNYPEGNIFHYGSDSLDVTRFQFVPDSLEGAVIEYNFHNAKQSALQLEFAFTATSDLLPVWLSDSLHIQNGNDRVAYDKTIDALIFSDSLNDWSAVVSANMASAHHQAPSTTCETPRSGSGVNGTLSYLLNIPAGDSRSLQIFIAGSSQNQDLAVQQLAVLEKNLPGLLTKKIETFHRIQEMSAVSLPDTAIEKMYTWLKYNVQWLERDVPGTGEGLSAGLPDYPWWFGCDNEYALQGVLCAGEFETVRKTIQLLHQLSETKNGNGRITHEVSTNGVPYNRGNVNETPQFIMLLWDYFLWTGDLDLIRQYYPSVKDGLHWLMSMDHDGNLCPDGAGMMEIAGLNSEMIDVASYTCRAFDAASKMAVLFGDSVNAAAYRRNFKFLRKEINDDWWVAGQNSFADFRANRAKALEAIADAKSRAIGLKKPWAVDELEALAGKVRAQSAQGNRGYVVYHNWVVNTPMETGLADSSYAIPALNTAGRFTNPFGMYVTGIDRDENAHNANIDSMRKKTFSYTGAVMTLPTGVQAVAECRYGRTEEALDYLTKLSHSFSYALPGSMYEVSPDFGMITQAWNIYGVEVPVIRYFFGISPDAYRKTIMIHPALPLGWSDVKLSRLRVGDNFLTMAIHTEKDSTIVGLTQTQPDWVIRFNPPKNMVAGEVNGSTPASRNITLTGLKNIIVLKPLATR